MQMLETLDNKSISKTYRNHSGPGVAIEVYKVHISGQVDCATWDLFNLTLVGIIEDAKIARGNGSKNLSNNPIVFPSLKLWL